MHAREVGRKRPKILPFKGEREVHSKTKWMRVCCGIDSGRERKRYTCLEVVKGEYIWPEG